jgi:hypothetical protein
VAGTFDSMGFFGNETLHSVDYYDMFIAKYNDKGILQWVRQAGGGMGDFALGLCVHRADLVYVTGYYKNSATFGGIESRYGAESEAFVTKIDFGVGIWDVPRQRVSIPIYPNPGDGNFTLTLPEEIPPGALVTVTDIQGREVLKQEAGGGDNGFNLSFLNSGIYLVTVRDEKISGTERIVVQH